MRLIDADIIVNYQTYDDEYEELQNHKSTIAEFLNTMTDEGCPEAVDAAPVRHGRWIKKRYWSDWYGMGESYGYWYKCSECGGEVKGGYESCDNKFCRNCGADMWKDGDDGKSD